MTDVRQFGDRAAHSLDCARCEAMLADAVDGALAPEEQAFFDAHITGCTSCEQLLAEARRGAAWLEMLRTPAPEPPPALLEKILAQTAGSYALHPVTLASPAPAMAPGYGNVLPFPRRAVATMRGGSLGRIVFEPRLAMTAAMAFLSIALTMDLMGVNPMDLRAHDLTPSGLHRTFAQLDARAVQYYEGLRVVYELESRVHDFQNVQDSAQDAPAQSQNQNQAPAAGTDQAQPSSDPADQTDAPAPQDQNQSAPQAAPNQQQPKSPSHKSAPADGVSRREETRPTQVHGSFAALMQRNRKAVQPTASNAMLEDVLAAYTQTDSDSDVEAYLGGTSSLARMPLPHPSRAAERRAA